MLRSGAFMRRQDLAGVQDVVGIDGALDCAHQVDGHIAVLQRHVGLLADADAMFAGAGAVHADGALGQARGEFLGAGQVLGLVRIGQQHDVEIAVADMADQRPLEVGGLGIEVGEGFGDAIGEARDRHADVGGQRAAARLEPEPA
jgi:hypothetical protein